VRVVGTTPPDGSSPTLAGKRIGRYVVDRLLGEGGMATVWRAVHEQLGGEVAIKILAPEAVRGEQELERFFREAKVCAQLNHDHVVKVIDFARDPDVGSYIVMELLNGRGLDRVLVEEGPLEEGRAVALALQITDALAAAHALDIVHRDLKPANIFVTRTLGTEIVKVMDFGIAKIPMSRAVALTRPGEIYGTPLYVSPEQWDNGPISEATDIYSLGVVLYEMLAGKPPLNGSALTELVKNVALGEPAPLASHRPTISPDLDAIVQQCLRKRPTERFASMRELRAALERVQCGLDVTHTMAGVDSSRAAVRPKRRGVFVAVATVSFVVALAAAVTFAGGRWRRHHSFPVTSNAPTSVTPNDTAPPASQPAPTSTTELTSGALAVRTVTPKALAAPAPPPARRARPAPSTRVRPAGPSKSTSPPEEDDLLRKE
jgi:eukaryotic-like serine/threonine-protein kinase